MENDRRVWQTHPVYSGRGNLVRYRKVHFSMLKNLMQVRDLPPALNSDMEKTNDGKILLYYLGDGSGDKNLPEADVVTLATIEKMRRV